VDGEEEPVTNAGGVAEGGEATCTGGAARGDGGGGKEGTCNEGEKCGGGGGGGGGDTVETVAKVSDEHVSTSLLVARSTSSLKWQRKSSPIIGKETTASKKIHWNHLP